ncbi:hypothetical protein DF184_10915 (plasmid) [Streptococcus suis]|nr:hypothetical protein DF184_10915 [Streptococcus suis]
MKKHLSIQLVAEAGKKILMQVATLYVLSNIFLEDVRMMNDTTKFKELNTETLKNINGGGVGDFIQGVFYEIFNSAKPKKRK